MQRLDEDYRTILLLREFDGFDYQTIAEVLEIKVGTVRSRLSRARQQLRSELSSYRGVRKQDITPPAAKTDNHRIPSSRG